MPRGFFGFYLKITVGWLNLCIRGTWNFFYYIGLDWGIEQKDYVEYFGVS